MILAKSAERVHGILGVAASQALVELLQVNRHTSLHGQRQQLVTGRTEQTSQWA